MPLLIPNDLRVRVGLAANDASRDAEITAAWETGKALAETYCDRKFSHGIDAESFTHVSDGTISLHRYPVNSITSIDIDTPYHLESKTGLIHFDGLAHAHKITVVYEGGYPTLPADLEFALLTVFDVVYGPLSNQTGLQTGGAIKAISSDGARVEFATSGGDNASGTDPDSGLPAAVVAMLRPYRRRHA